MAYKIKLNKRFVRNSEQVAAWLEKKWSKRVADDFARKLNAAILSLSENPFIGSSSTENKSVRKFTVTKHNKIYYRVKGKLVTFLELFDTRKNPKRNKYE
jgi:plasmid stabilization system protein ParE